MNVAGCVVAVLSGAAMNAAAQNFVDLDFDQAQVPDPDASTLSWEQGAPGWGHSDGDSTGFLYYNFSHAGYSQYYALLSSPFGIALCCPHCW